MFSLSSLSFRTLGVPHRDKPLCLVSSKGSGLIRLVLNHDLQSGNAARFDHLDEIPESGGSSGAGGLAGWVTDESSDGRQTSAEWTPPREDTI